MLLQELGDESEQGSKCTQQEALLGEMERHQICGRVFSSQWFVNQPSAGGQSICTMHSTSPPPSSLFLKTGISVGQSSSEPVHVCPSQGRKGSHVNHITKSKELHPSPSECVWNVVSESSESPRGSGTEPGTEIGRNSLGHFIPSPGNNLRPGPWILCATGFFSFLLPQKVPGHVSIAPAWLEIKPELGNPSSLGAPPLDRHGDHYPHIIRQNWIN